jgi:hypothetical protein
MTRQSVPKIRRRAAYSVGIIDEIYNFSAFELDMHIRILVDCGAKKIILIGDESQREPVTGLPINYKFIHHVLQFHTSLGMPLDAHGLFVLANGLDNRVYTTTGTNPESIYMIEEENFLSHESVQFKPHGFLGPDRFELTIGGIQGCRFKHAQFQTMSNLRQTAWLFDQLNRLSVALTRHSETLIINCQAADMRRICRERDPQPCQRIHGGRAQLEHTLKPAADNLLSPVQSAKLDRLAPGLRAVLSDPLAMDGHHIVPMVFETVPEFQASVGEVPRSEIEAVVLENTNFSLPDPAEMDFITDAAKNFRFRETGPPIQRSDVRNDIPNAHLMAAIHSNQSAFDNLKNLIERQLANLKSSSFGTPEMNEGARMHQRFVESYYAETADILDVEKSVSWLISREESALKQILMNEPLGETSKSLTVDAEFKTQSKAKAVPGFAATLPYGQSILANSKGFNAYFSGVQPRAYLNAQKRLRCGIVLDYGLSDDDLSSKLRLIGAAAEMNGAQNVQADVSRQDSSHTAATLYAFILFLRDCGADQGELDFYLAYCRKYMFLSRGADACKGEVSFNLGSGDPFTLLRNDHMELLVVCLRYVHADTAIIVEKGDDVHGVIKDLTPRPVGSFPSIRNVVLKIDYGQVGYHAGRFHDGNRYIVDPVRAFLKHLTRLSDANVTEETLYRSYVSRATDYSDAEVEFLLVACQVHYPFFSSSQISVIIDFMISIRTRAVFVRYSKLRLPEFAITVDTESNCLMNCVAALRPGKPKWYYRRFRSLHISQAKALLDAEGIPYVIVDNFDETVGKIMLTSTHAKVIIRYV